MSARRSRPEGATHKGGSQQNRHAGSAINSAAIFGSIFKAEFCIGLNLHLSTLLLALHVLDTGSIGVRPYGPLLQDGYDVGPHEEHTVDMQNQLPCVQPMDMTNMASSAAQVDTNHIARIVGDMP